MRVFAALPGALVLLQVCARSVSLVSSHSIIIHVHTRVVSMTSADASVAASTEWHR
jgi:hypothetical protein